MRNPAIEKVARKALNGILGKSIMERKEYGGMIYLLDTNACVEYLRQRNAKVVQRIAATSPSDLRLCSVVVAELYYGAYGSTDAGRPASRDFLPAASR